MAEPGNQAFAEARNYLLAQAELGTFELVLKEPVILMPRVAAAVPAIPAVATVPIAPASPAAVPMPQPLAPIAPPSTENDNLWTSAQNANEFYEALKQHSLYKKSTRLSSFETPKEKKNAPYILIFHSPKELSAEAKEMLKRLFEKLGIEFEACAISFFIKSNWAVMPREKTALAEMLKKEIALLNPEKIIFFRENPSSEKGVKIDGNPIVFAGKAAITLYSPLEMLPSREKRLETWNSHLPRSNWFGIF